MSEQVSALKVGTALNGAYLLMVVDSIFAMVISAVC